MSRREELEESRGLHPIVPLATLELLSPAGGWVSCIEPEREAKILALLDEARADGTIEAAMLDLVRLAGLLELEGVGGALVSDLVGLLDHAISMHQLIAKTNGPAASIERNARAPAHQAIGGRPLLKAPMLGDAAPAGSLRVHRLTPARQRI